MCARPIVWREKSGVEEKPLLSSKEEGRSGEGTPQGGSMIRVSSNRALRFFPVGGNVAATEAVARQILIVVEVEMTIHLDRLRDAGANEVIGVVATAAEGKVRFGGVEGAGKGSISVELDAGIGGQAEIVKACGISVFVHDSIAGDLECRASHE